MKKLRYITKKGKLSQAVAFINNDGSIKSLGIEGAFNGLRHHYMCDAFRRAILNNDTSRFQEEGF